MLLKTPSIDWIYGLLQRAGSWAVSQYWFESSLQLSKIIGSESGIGIGIVRIVFLSSPVGNSLFPISLTTAALRCASAAAFLDSVLGRAEDLCDFFPLEVGDVPART